jgi:Fe-S oxidoreductase
MDDRTLFRYGPAYAPVALETALDWSEWGSFASAAEMCNNNGACRKDAAVMCPSFVATQDEHDVTRGRANALRLALTGQLGPDALASDEMYAVMDLCVGCKACKRECPTGVDMARMKIEFLAHYKSRHGHSVRDRLFARLPDYAPILSRVPWLSNIRDRLPGGRQMGERLLGLSAARALPRWRSDTFWRARAEIPWASRAQVLEAGAAGGKAVVLLVDTFNGAFEPENAVAAARVLQAAGYRVHALENRGRPYCCGRTYLSGGMFERARGKAAELLGALEDFARLRLPIIGLEPSCLLTLRDEWRVMHLGESAELIASNAWLFEEFLAREARAGRMSLALEPVSAPILLHGHCHQKAFGAVDAVLEVLRLIPGSQPELIDSSCCGMAGSFGYEAEHHEISMKMAELKLFPALRAQPRAIVVADGTSCRHQIRDGMGREALHVARLLERLLSKRGA